MNWVQKKPIIQTREAASPAVLASDPTPGPIRQRRSSLLDLLKLLLQAGRLALPIAQVVPGQSRKHNPEGS